MIPDPARPPQKPTKNHIFLDVSNQLQVLFKEELKQSLGDVAFIAEELSPHPTGHFGDGDPIISIGRRQFKRE
jgi:hypothetical protein